MESTLFWTCTKMYCQTSFVAKEFLTGQLTLEVRIPRPYSMYSHPMSCEINIILPTRVFLLLQLQRDFHIHWTSHTKWTLLLDIRLLRYIANKLSSCTLTFELTCRSLMAKTRKALMLQIFNGCVCWTSLFRTVQSVAGQTTNSLRRHQQLIRTCTTILMVKHIYYSPYIHTPLHQAKAIPFRSPYKLGKFLGESGSSVC